MSAPRLNRRLWLEAPVRVPDGSGGYAAGWETLGMLWAEVTAQGGREATGIGAALSRVGYRITVRAAPEGSPRRPRAEQRFRDGARVFRVLAVAEGDPQGRTLICHAQEETAA